MPKSSGRRKPPARPRARTSGPASTRARRPPLVPQPAPGLRGTVERASAPALLWLSARPKFLIPLLSAVLLLGGLAAPTAYGGPLLLALGLLLLWLSYLSWPALDGRARMRRAAMLALIAVALVQRVFA